ncbi:hypothetical protein E2320_011074, partial [Naja naja]
MARPAGASLWRLRHLFSHLSRSATLAAVPRSTAAYSTAITSAKVEVNGIHLHYQQTGNGNHAVLLLPGMLGIRDVSKWSEKTRKPLEEMYGYEYFSKMGSAWVDGISQFVQQSD